MTLTKRTTGPDPDKVRPEEGAGVPAGIETET